jgi:hypothetical protein
MLCLSDVPLAAQFLKEKTMKDHSDQSANSANSAMPKTHDGKVVSVAGDKLTTTCGEGKQHVHTMAKDARITHDGQASKAADLKAGTSVRVTTSKDDKNVATSVESGKHIPAMGHKA